MSWQKAFWNSTFGIFIVKKRREFINDIVLGSFLGIKIFEWTANFHFLGLKEYLHPAFAILCSLSFFLLDLYLFYKEDNQMIQKDINALNKSMQEVIDKHNQLEIAIAKGAIMRENDLMRKLINNNLEVDALQNFEYLRKIYSRVLNQVMKKGDHYITLSNIDFWTMSPKETLDEFIANHDDAIHAGKNIHRLVVIDRLKFFSHSFDNDLTDDEKKTIADKRQSLLKLLRQFDKKFEITDKGTNYFNPFKFFCYLTDTNTKSSFDLYLPSVIVVKSNYKDILLLYATNIANVELQNPKIHIKHFSFKKIDVENNRNNVIEILKAIKIAIDDKESRLSKRNDQLNPDDCKLRDYIDKYILAFCDLGNTYNLTTGEKNMNIDIEKTKVYDIPMMIGKYDTFV
jgi:hypothetical protein